MVTGAVYVRISTIPFTFIIKFWTRPFRLIVCHKFVRQLSSYCFCVLHPCIFEMPSTFLHHRLHMHDNTCIKSEAPFIAHENSLLDLDCVKTMEMVEPFILPPRFGFFVFCRSSVRLLGARCKLVGFNSGHLQQCYMHFGYCRLRWLTLSFGKFDPELKSNPLAERWQSGRGLLRCRQEIWIEFW